MRITCLLGLVASALLFGCAADLPSAAESVAAVPVVSEMATAVPFMVPPTATPPLTLTAVPTSPPTPVPTPAPPTFANPLDDQMVQTAATYGADFVRFTPENCGIWAYATSNFLHPLALERRENWGYLLDGGRVLAFDLAQPNAPQTLLVPGDAVEGVRVMEPLDLAVGEAGLFVLDRVGDVYRYDFADGDGRNGRWTIARYDRPVSDTSGHYYVALDADVESASQFLLETNYKLGIQTSSESPDLLWPLPDVRAVDINAQGSDVYVLAREMDTWAGQLLRYQDTRLLRDFKPPPIISQPRQVVAGETAVYVLDQAGKRLLTFARDTGALQTVYQLPQHDQISAFWIDFAAQDLILAGRDRLFFYRQPDRLQTIPGGSVLSLPQPHDPDFLSSSRNFVVPIGGSGITEREFQLPGAPRHYRLGIHHGIDFYWQPGTTVYAAADGIVIRAMLDYVSPTQAQFNSWRAEITRLGYTSEAALDVYRGRQVWVQHENGLVTRYVHLSSIAPGITAGTTVTQGQMLGAVGNSGSPLSLESETADAHLHFEIWLNDYYLGQFLRPIEVREWIETVLGQ